MPAKTGNRSVPLDATVLQILWLLMRTFVRCGFSSEDIAKQLVTFGQQMARAPANARRRHLDAGRDDWVQIMTLWSMDPTYVDEDGRPLLLRMRGGAPSIEALLRRVRSTLTIPQVCDQLIATGAAKRVKGRMASLAHAPIVFPPGSQEQSAHHLELLYGVLLNIEHNASPPDGALWVERQSICHNFPQSALSAYSAGTGERVQAFLAKEDANMHRIANFTPSNGRTVRATVQVIFSARNADLVPPPGPQRTGQKALARTRHSATRQRKRASAKGRS